MEETTNNKNQNQVFTPVNLNRKAPPYFLVAALVVLIIGILSYLVFFQKLSFFKPRPTGTIAPQEEAKVTIKIIPYATEQEKGVQVYLSNINKAVEIPAFQIEFSLPANTTQENILIKVNPQMEAQMWKFPIARFEKENDSALIKLSGYRLGNSPYEIKGNLLIATISSKDQTAVFLEVVKENTVLYSSDAVTKIPFNVNIEK